MQNKWKQLSNVIIPPLASTGFQETVIIRKPIEPLHGKCDNEMTSVLMDTEVMETVVILQKQETVQYLVMRLNPGEIYVIEKYPFIIGKSHTCDFNIKGNPAISRQHVQIFQESEHFYLKDLQSSNHTYMKNVMVKEVVELIDGMAFRLADEEFIFQKKGEGV